MTGAPVLDQLRDAILDVRTAMSEQLAERYLPQILSRIEATVAHVPPAEGDELIVDIGCYGPVLGPLHTFLGYKRMGAVAKYDWGPCDSVVLPQWAKSRGIDLSIWFGDIEKQHLPWKDGEADTVLMLEILEHFALDPMFALAEANRILKTGGRIILSTPNAASSDALVRVIAGKNPHLGLQYNGVDNNRHNRLYDADELIELLRCSGFDDIRIETISCGTIAQLGGRAAFIYWISKLVGGTRGNNMRGPYLLASATRTSAIRDRYPRLLYLNRTPEFVEAARKHAATSPTRPQSRAG